MSKGGRTGSKQRAKKIRSGEAPRVDGPFQYGSTVAKKRDRLSVLETQIRRDDPGNPTVKREMWTGGVIGGEGEDNTKRIFGGDTVDRDSFVFGEDRHRCPRCLSTWVTHPAGRHCIEKGIGFVEPGGDQYGPVDYVVSVLVDNGQVSVFTTGFFPADAPAETVIHAARMALAQAKELGSSALGVSFDESVPKMSSTQVHASPADSTVVLRAPCVPAQMPDERLRLIAGWDSPAWQITSAGNMTRSRETGVAVDPVGDASVYVGWEKQMLAEAGLWWVGMEMCDVLFAAAPNIPAETEVSDLTWPDEGGSGLVILERPWHGVDAVEAGHVVTVDAFVWGGAMLPPGDDHPNGMPCVSISTYRLLRFEDGMSPGELGLAQAFDVFGQGKRHLESVTHRDGQTATTFNLTGSAWVPLGRSDWPLGEPLGRPLDLGLPDTPGGQRYAESAVEDRRMLAALWALLVTKGLATVGDHGIDRQARRRSDRAGVTTPSTVKIVYLRRPDAPTDEEHVTDHRAVNWSHRWIVNAHPRLQPYGPGRRQRKLIMVGPYTKGPADKELVVKSTVKAVVR